MQKLLDCLKTEVFVADDFSDLSKYTSSIDKKVLWVCDTTTSKMVRPLPEPHVIIEAGEGAKSFRSVEKIVSAAVQKNFKKDDFFLALGGGVVSDVTGFAASVYKRGCKFMIIPTTLVSMVDASIGGKTCINFENVKNLVGNFYPADKVIICTDCLQTLSENSYMSGLGEVLKTSFLSKDQELLKTLVINKSEVLNRSKDTMLKVIELCIKTKSLYVTEDPYDNKGVRCALNLGHTFGHALESLRRMKVSHGQAVAWGVCKSIAISKELNLCSDLFEESVIRLFTDYHFDINYKINYGEWNEYLSFLKNDKKSFNDKIKFVLLKDQGTVTEEYLEEKIIKKHILEDDGSINVLF